MIGPYSPTLYVLLTQRPSNQSRPPPAFSRRRRVSKAGAHSSMRRRLTDFVRMRVADARLLRDAKLKSRGRGGKKPPPLRVAHLREPQQRGERKKIEMFNTGETALFRRTGLQPVFFGETLIGTKLPNLTYMLTFPDMATRDKNWGTFIADPEWKKMSATPGFTDAEIVTNISSVFLRPTSYSEI